MDRKGEGDRGKGGGGGRVEGKGLSDISRQR